MKQELEIKEYNGVGYKPQIDFGSWRVALANVAPQWEKDNITFVERHIETDEVFVLLEGSVTLLIGNEQTPYAMEANKLYNVKRGTWHQMTMSKDAKVLIVENNDTGEHNTEYMNI